MRTAAWLVILAAATPAHASSPTLDDAWRLIDGVGIALSERAGDGALATYEDVARALSPAFTYDGLTYDARNAEPDQRAAARSGAMRCTTDYGAHGTVQRDRPAFLRCLALSSYEAASGDNGSDRFEADLTKLPAPLRPYAERLKKLAVDHWLLVSHLDRHWNVYAVEHGKDVLRWSGVIVVTR